MSKQISTEAIKSTLDRLAYIVHDAYDDDGQSVSIETDFAWAVLSAIDGLRRENAFLREGNPAGSKIIEALRDAVKGNLARVTIGNQTWVRADAGSPEEQLAQARITIADLTTEVDRLKAAGDGLREFAANLMAACAAIMFAWYDKASPDIIEKIEKELHPGLFKACEEWNRLSPPEPATQEGGE